MTRAHGIAAARNALGSPYALLRLAWRPLMLLGVVLTPPIAGVPFLLVADELNLSWRALWQSTATREIENALWQGLVLASAWLGYGVSLFRLELQHTTLSWHLPGLRRGLVAGTVLAAVAVALPLALLIGRHEPAGAAVAAFAIAGSAFLMPGFFLDVAVPLPARIAAGVCLTALATQPAAVAAFAAAHPALLTLAALAVAGVMASAVSSRRLARRRPFRWSRFLQAGTRDERWSTRRGTLREWRHKLATDRLFPWLRAAAYEAELRVPVQHLLYAALAVMVATLFNNPGLVTPFAGGFLLSFGLHLSPQLSYPLARERRAQLAYLGTLADAALYFAFVALLFYATSFIPLLRLKLAWSETTSLDAIIAVGCAFALAPIAQSGRIHWPQDGRRGKSSRKIAHFFLLLAYVLGVGVFSLTMHGSGRGPKDPQTILVTIAIVTVMAQLLQALHLHQHYTRSDLVTARE